MAVDIDPGNRALAKPDVGAPVARHQPAQELKDVGIVAHHQHAFPVGILGQQTLESRVVGSRCKCVADLNLRLIPKFRPHELSRLEGAFQGAGDDHVNLRSQSAQHACHEHALVLAFLHQGPLGIQQGIFAEKTGVTRIVAQTYEGSFGLLPHRLDCVAALAPGILIYQTESGPEVVVAVDEGVMVKTGLDVLVSVRRAIGGTDLSQLRAAVAKEFLTLDDQERSVRSVMAKLEIGLLRRMATFQHD